MTTTTTLATQVRRGDILVTYHADAAPYIHRTYREVLDVLTDEGDVILIVHNDTVDLYAEETVDIYTEDPERGQHEPHCGCWI